MFDAFKSTMKLYDASIKPIADYYASSRLEFNTSKNSKQVVSEEIVKVLKEKNLI